MKLQNRKMYENRTHKYLSPIMRWFGQEFVRRFNPLGKLAYGIHDEVMSNTEVAKKPLIYVMFNREFKRKLFSEFLLWLKYESYYVTDYPAGSSIESPRHMIVLEVPKNFHNAYYSFLEGKYSQMFTVFEKENLFSPIKNEEAYKVLSKDPEYIPQFLEELRNRGWVSTTQDTSKWVTTQDVEGMELDFPLQREEEVFNYVHDRTSGKNRFIKSKQDIL